MNVQVEIKNIISSLEDISALHEAGDFVRADDLCSHTLDCLLDVYKQTAIDKFIKDSQ